MNRLLLIFFALLPSMAIAHAGSQGLILLLPTTLYITAGGITVLVTVLLAAVLNHRQLNLAFSPWITLQAKAPKQTLTSLGATVLYGALIWIGLFGPHDPLANLMSLTTWTVFWIAFVLACGLLGNLWHWVNPWSGLYSLVMGDAPAPATLPVWMGYWPAILGLMAFNAYGIANPAATDPIQLAILGSLYWIFTFLMMVIFGPAWLKRGEFFSVFLSLISKISSLKKDDVLHIGLPGWRIIATATPPLTLALFSLTLLGTGTFDGFNETFFWLVQLGINPLEFPGRSAIVTQTVLGLIAANIALIALFFGCIWLTTPREHLSSMFRRQSLSILPIALAYHFAHFLPSLLVDAQYTIKAMTDPMQSGADYLGLGQFYVTTGFFNTLATQRVIFVTEASAIVLGHILAILLSHRIAADYFPTRRRVLTSQIPLSVFMIGYTVLGLWLLATPKGA